MSTNTQSGEDEDLGADFETLLYRQGEKENKSEKIYNLISKKFQPIYDRIFGRRNQFVSNVSLKLKQAGRSEPVEVYLSAYMGMGAISGALMGIVSAILLLPLYNQMFVPSFLLKSEIIINQYVDFIIANGLLLISVLVGLLTITSISSILFAGIMVYAAVKIPESKIKQRKKEIEILLPDAIAFMYCLSVSGMSRIEIMRELAASEEIYSEVSVEFQRIIHRVDMFSEDYTTSISNVVEITPSEDLASFLNDMLSTISSGGEMDSFLETQMNITMENVERSQKMELDNLEIFNEAYITLSLIPVIGIIVLSFAGAMGLASSIHLVLIGYFGVGIIQLGSLLIITTIFQNDYGEGKLERDEGDNFEFVNDETENIFSAGVAKDYQGDSPMFDQIYANEIRTRLFKFLSNPISYVKKKPEYTFVMTVPTALVFVIMVLISGSVELTTDYVINNGFRTTFLLFYFPIIIGIAPYVYFYELDMYKRGSITDGLTKDLNKLANTNQRGITFQESLRITSEDRDTKLAKEFQEIYKKQQMKIPMGKAIIETNNKYRIPRLARIFRIIKSAQDVTDNINQVLDTASDLAYRQHSIIQERKSRTRQQVGVVGIIFLVFIAALVLMNTFIVPNAGDLTQVSGGGGSIGAQGLDQLGGEPVSQEIIAIIGFHAALLQSILAGAISGYIRTGEFKPGIKYSLIYGSLTMLVWVLIA